MLMKIIKNNKYIKNIVFLQLVYLYYSLIGILSKKVAQYSFGSFYFIFGYLLLLLIIFIYALLWQQVIKRNSLFVAYANKGTVILWTLVWAVLFFRESISANNIIGSVIIIIGIVLVAKDE